MRSMFKPKSPIKESRPKVEHILVYNPTNKTWNRVSDPRSPRNDRTDTIEGQERERSLHRKKST